MLNIAPTDFLHTRNETARHRRALVIVDSASPVLPSQLAVSGYEAFAATTLTARQAVQEFAPDVAILEIHHGGETEAIALARRLRAEPATYALPLIFVWNKDDRATRNAALNIGVDDYFALSLPFSDILVRLDSLFWRIEAGRRTVASTGDQRLEIDNFMLMLDTVREDIDKGAVGSLAVINAAGVEGKPLEKQTRDRVLAEAHGFLKLYLRRIDTVAFYGPTTLLVYLPRMSESAGEEALSKLRHDFLHEHPQSDISIGIASFPDDATDVEDLIEKAEAAASQPAEARPEVAADKTADSALREAVPALRVVEEKRREANVSEIAAGIISALGEETKTTKAFAEDDARIVEPARVATRERAPVEVEKKSEAVAEKAEAAAAVPQRAEKFVSHLVREKKLEDGFEAVVAPPPVRKSHLPTNGAEARRALDAAARERERRSRGALMPRRLLLTVSDAARMAQLNSLIRSAGYEARAAFDGQQALDLLRIERPDLLVLDYELQGIDGLETIRRLRKQNGGRLTLPVVLLLSEAHESVRQEAVALGARGIVRMPYDPTELLDSVRSAGMVE